MSQNLSISVSDARRYLVTALATAALFSLLICAISFIGVREGLSDWKELAVIQLQKQRLRDHPDFDVLMVGDSSLANAVDSQAWSDQLNRRVLSLPLVGIYGYEGSLNMIRRALRLHRPEMIVIFHTPDMMTRKISWPGILFTAETWSDLHGFQPWRALKPLANWDIPFSMIRQAALGRAYEPGAFEYPDQYAPHFTKPLNREALVPTRLRVEKARYLNEIGQICQQQNIPCLYVHGPYIQPECGQAGAYLAEVENLIRKAGLILVTQTPFCLTREQAGDAADHVHPQFKAQFSHAYLTRVIATLESAGLHPTDK